MDQKQWWIWALKYFALHNDGVFGSRKLMAILLSFFQVNFEKFYELTTSSCRNTVKT
jgi:hypothetical protein